MVQDDYQWLERIVWSLVHWRVCHSCPQFPTLQNVDIMVDPCSIWKFSCACFGVHRRSGFSCSRPERNCKKHKRRSFSCHGCLSVRKNWGLPHSPVWRTLKDWEIMEPHGNLTHLRTPLRVQILRPTFLARQHGSALATVKQKLWQVCRKRTTSLPQIEYNNINMLI